MHEGVHLCAEWLPGMLRRAPLRRVATRHARVEYIPMRRVATRHARVEYRRCAEWLPGMLRCVPTMSRVATWHATVMQRCAEWLPGMLRCSTTMRRVATRHATVCSRRCAEWLPGMQEMLEPMRRVATRHAGERATLRREVQAVHGAGYRAAYRPSHHGCRPAVPASLPPYTLGYTSMPAGLSHTCWSSAPRCASAGDDALGSFFREVVGSPGRRAYSAQSRLVSSRKGVPEHQH